MRGSVFAGRCRNEGNSRNRKQYMQSIRKHLNCKQESFAYYCQGQISSHFSLAKPNKTPEMRCHFCTADSQLQLPISAQSGARELDRALCSLCCPKEGPRCQRQTTKNIDESKQALSTGNEIADIPPATRRFLVAHGMAAAPTKVHTVSHLMKCDVVLLPFFFLSLLSCFQVCSPSHPIQACPLPE